MSENELKLCPFCGHTPTIYELKCGWYVDCDNDKCSHYPQQQNGKHLRRYAVNAWNNRFEDPS